MHLLIRTTVLACIPLCLSVTTSIAGNTIQQPAFETPAPAPSRLSLAGRIWKLDYTRTLVAGIALTRIARYYDDPAGLDAARSWAETVAIGDSYGNGLYLAGFTALVWGYGSLSGRNELRQTGHTMMEGLLLDAIVVNTLKTAIGRTRPDGSDNRSFPSGHTTAAFTISSILVRRHGWVIGLPAIGLATFTAIARMEDKRHYLSDVVAGAALGVAVGQLVTPHKHADRGGLQLVAGPSRVGLQLKF